MHSGIDVDTLAQIFKTIWLVQAQNYSRNGEFIMNDVKLTGRLTAQPEIRHSGNGKSDICRFTLAVYNTPGSTDFIGCVAFGKTAQIIAKNCAKGQVLAVSASIHNNNYMDNNGIKRYGYNITVNRVYLCGKGVSK